MKTTLFLLAAVVALSSTALGQSQAPEAAETAVKAAAMDYLNTFYEGDEAALSRSIHPQVYKWGYYRPGNESAYGAGQQMTHEQMQEFAANARKRMAEGRGVSADAPKRVEILDLQDQTAAVKVYAWWGTDYMLLGKEDGRWVIRHVIWQSYPAQN